MSTGWGDPPSSTTGPGLYLAEPGLYLAEPGRDLARPVLYLGEPRLYLGEPRLYLGGAGAVPRRQDVRRASVSLTRAPVRRTALE